MDIAHREPLLSQKRECYDKTRFSTVVGMGLLASSLFLLPMTTPPFAQTTNPPPQTRVVKHAPSPTGPAYGGLLGLAASRG